MHLSALQTTDKSSKEYQRMTWEALKKSINGLVNKVNVSNIANIIEEVSVRISSRNQHEMLNESEICLQFN